MQPVFSVNHYLVEGSAWHLRLNKDWRFALQRWHEDFSSSLKAGEGVTSAPGSSFAHVSVEDVAQGRSLFKLWYLPEQCKSRLHAELARKILSTILQLPVGSKSKKFLWTLCLSKREDWPNMQHVFGNLTYQHEGSVKVKSSIRWNFDTILRRKRDNTREYPCSYKIRHIWSLPNKPDLPNLPRWEDDHWKGHLHWEEVGKWLDII